MSISATQRNLVVSISAGVHRFASGTDCDEFIETPHYGYPWQLQRVRDLTCTNRRVHDGSQEDVNADGSIGQAVTVGRKLRALVVAYGGSPASIKASVNNAVSSRAQPTLLNCLLILNEGCSSSTRATAACVIKARELCEGRG